VREPLYFHGKSVLIVDDVLTTSATLTECARVVREAGAARIGILALAGGG
jgi:predicted amidophosphoribosyltransferase